MRDDDSKFPLTIFFDGSCSVCSAEMEHYRAQDEDSRLVFVDIQAEDFAPGEFGPSRREFMKQLHVLDGRGRYHLGVDGFAAIWEALPGLRYRTAAGLIRLPVIHFLARVGYWLFAKFRRFLPATNTPCGAGHCPLEGDGKEGRG